MNIKQFLIDNVRGTIDDDDCAVLLSGGVDSISVALAAHHAGKQITAYSFHLNNDISYDFKTAEKISKQMNWKFVGISVPTNDIKSDFMRLVDYGCKNKTHYETLFPFLYIYPKIKEKYVVTGWGADGYFGVSKKAQMRWSSAKSTEKYAKWCRENNAKQITFDEYREAYFHPDKTAGLKYHNMLVDEHNKIHVHPYMNKDIKDYFFQFDWVALNKPYQKHHIRNAFNEFNIFDKIKPHQNLHLNAGIDKIFETLLEDKEINFNNRKRVMDLCRDWNKEWNIARIF